MSSLKYILLFCFVFTASISSAYQEVTHETLNTAISELSGLENYLVKNLDLSEGINTEIDKLKIYKWLAFGGKEEDSPFWRPMNHFHDPLANSWNQAGLLHTNTSSVLWAQDPENEWSWPAARKYFYAALTGNSSEIGGRPGLNETERGVYFAKTFRSLGQIMHLTEDKTVPSHVRNDSHIIESVLQLTNYEKIVKKFGDRKEDIYSPALFENAYENPVNFDHSILSQTPNPLAPIPIARIIDTDTYNRASGPDVTIGNKIGLAEYTNANFFSEDTINSSSYPQPDIENCAEIVTMDFLSTDGNVYKRKYFKKTADTNCGETNNGEGYLLSAVDKLYYWRKLPIINLLLSAIPLLDTNVYRDYASLLLPRAVGYSASLLDYFFRGEIGMARTLNGGYIIENHNDEPMTGNFALYYDDAAGNRKLVQDGNEVAAWNLVIGPKNSENNTPGKSEPVSFTPPDDANEPGKYMLVFRGQMGNEADAVAGRSVNLSLEYWEPWGETICENNNWEIVDSTKNHTGTLCDSLGVFSLNNGLLSTSLSESGSHLIIWDYSDNNYQPITNADLMKIKISAHASEDVLWGGVFIAMVDDNYNDNDFFIVFSSANYKVDNSNNGNEQIIDLREFGLNGTIIYFSISAWKTIYSTDPGSVSFDLDYIDFLAAE